MKKRQVVFYVVLLLMLFCTSVYATISGNINITPSKSGSLTAGEEFTVTLSLDNIEATSGITAVEGYININENVLEDLTVNSIVTNSDGKVEINSKNILNVYDASEEGAENVNTGITFNTEPVSGNGDYRLVIDLADPLTSNTNLVTITFKVKPGVTSGTYNDAISYSLFKIYSGTQEKADVVSKSLNIVVGTPSSGNDNTGNNSNNANTPVNNNSNNANNPANNNSNNANNAGRNEANNANNAAVNNANRNNISNNGSYNNNNNNRVDNTVAGGSLPNTGYKLVILPIIALAIAGFIFYKKYDKYSKF